jgi:hypothetical protein
MIMPARLRNFLAALSVFALLVGVTAPAYSSSGSMRSMMEGTDPVSPVFDVLVLRPVGLAALVGGFAVFVVTAPITLITRPHEIGKPFDRLVVGPARYVWVDPLGSH